MEWMERQPNRKAPSGALQGPRAHEARSGAEAAAWVGATVESAGTEGGGALPGGLYLHYLLWVGASDSPELTGLHACPSTRIIAPRTVASLAYFSLYRARSFRTRLGGGCAPARKRGVAGFGKAERNCNLCWCEVGGTSLPEHDDPWFNELGLAYAKAFVEIETAKREYDRQ